MKITTSGTNGKGIIELQKRLAKVSASVGILNNKKHTGTEQTTAQIGFIHEFGTSTTPERSFIRYTIQSKSKEIKGLGRKLYTQVLEGKISPKKGIDLLGSYTAGLIQKTFVNNDWKPNKPATSRRKGSTKPLIDTGQLRQSISWSTDD